MLHGAASVEAKSLDIGAVLEERHPFAVPRYQRAYAWDDEALGYFVRDVEAMLTSGLESSSHFFGGIVCIEHIDNQRIRPLSYEVVDGQQRLATFMLALSCVIEIAADQEREYLNSDQVASRQAATLRVDTDERYVTWKDADVAAGTTIVRPRLSLSLADDFIFQSLVGRKALPATTRESHELLVAARVELREMALRHVDVATSPVERVQRLFRLRQALVHNAHIIHVVSRERLQAYRLFSVLNHRGESLSDADLLRSRSLELLAAFPDEHEQVARLWDEMLSCPAKSVEAYIRALYPSWKGERSKGDLFESVEAAFLPDAVGTCEQADAVVQFVAMLRDELGVFLRLLDGSWPYDRTPGAGPEVKAWQIARLRRLTVTLKHELCLPVLLAGARTLTGAMFAELVYMLEVFAFRYKIVCNGHASRPATLYYQQALKMRDAAESGGGYTLGEFRRELRQLIARHAGDQLFKQLLTENLRYSNRSQRLNIRHFLSTLEDHHEWLERNLRNPGARPVPSMSKVIDVDESTIEHIYPQNASSNDQDVRLELVKHQIGNLTIFGSADNVAAGDKSFSAKSATNYAASAIAMTHALASNSSWTVKDVRDRENRLMAAATRVFVV